MNYSRTQSGTVPTFTLPTQNMRYQETQQRTQSGTAPTFNVPTQPQGGNNWWNNWGNNNSFGGYQPNNFNTTETTPPPQSNANTGQVDYTANTSEQVGAISPNYATVNWQQGKQATGTARNNMPYINTNTPLQITADFNQPGVNDPNVQGQQYSNFGDVNSIDIMNLTPDQRQQMLFDQLTQQAGQPLGMGTYGMTEDATQSLLMNPNMGRDPYANVGTRLSDFDLNQAQAMEAARESMADVAGRGAVEDQMLRAALSGAQGRSMLQADLEDRAILQERQNFMDALGAGQSVAQLGGSLQSQNVGNLIGAAGAFEGQEGRKLEEATTEAGMGFERSSILSEQNYDSTMNALDRIQQMNLTGLQGTNALLLEDARGKIEAGNLDAQLDFQGISQAISNDLQVALQNGEFENAANLTQLKGQIDASVADMQANRDIAIANRQLNSSEAIAMMRNDTEKWATELSAKLQEAGMESEEAMFAANLQVQATDNMLDRELNKEIAQGNLDIAIKELAQEAMQFGSEMEFRTYALERGYKEDEIARTWQASENAKERTLQTDMQTRTQDWQAEQNKLDRLTQETINDADNSIALKIAGMDNDTRMALAEIDERLQMEGLTLGAIQGMFANMGPEGAELQGEFLANYAQQNGIELPSVRDANEIAFIKGQLGDEAPQRGSNESLADYAGRLRDFASESGIKYSGSDVSEYVEQISGEGRLNGITYEDVVAGTVPLETLRGNPNAGGEWAERYRAITSSAPTISLEVNDRDNDIRGLPPVNGYAQVNGRLIRVVDKAVRDRGALRKDERIYTIEDVATGEQVRISGLSSSDNYRTYPTRYLNAWVEKLGMEQDGEGSGNNNRTGSVATWKI